MAQGTNIEAMSWSLPSLFYRRRSLLVLAPPWLIDGGASTSMVAPYAKMGDEGTSTSLAVRVMGERIFGGGDRIQVRHALFLFLYLGRDNFATASIYVRSTRVVPPLLTGDWR